MSRENRFPLPSHLAVWLVVACVAGVGLLRCDDSDNDNPGVDAAAMEMPEMECDAGLLPDGGCDMGMACESGIWLEDGGCAMCMGGATVLPDGGCDMGMHCESGIWLQDGGCAMCMDAGVLPDGGCDCMAGSARRADCGCKMCMEGVLADGGCKPLRGEIEIPSGPALYGISTEGSNKEAFWVMKHPGSSTAPVVSVLFDDFRHAGSMSSFGADPGAPQRSITTDPNRRLVHFTVEYTPRMVFFETGLDEQVYVGSLTLGGTNDKLSPGVLSADGGSLYVANETSQKLMKVNPVDRVIAAEATSSAVPELRSPSSVTVMNDGKLVVGSSSPAQDRFLVFNDTGSALTYDNALSNPLVDGASLGVKPGACTTVPGKAYLFCASGIPAADGGTEPGGILWKWTPGTAPKAVVTTAAMPSRVVSSPAGERLYVAMGNTLAVYWVAGPDADAPIHLRSITRTQPIFDVAPSPDGTLVYFSVPAANQLIILNASDLSQVAIRSNLNRPGPLFFSGTTVNRCQ